MLPLLLAASLVTGVSLQAVAATAPASKQQSSESAKPEKVHFAVVTVNNKPLIRLADTKDRHAQERANELKERLQMTLSAKKGQPIQPVQDSDIVVTTVIGQPVIRLRNLNVINVTPEDRKLNGQAQQALAQRWAGDLRAAVKSIKVVKGQALPATMIVVTTGVMDVPKTATTGGGGGGKPKHKPQPKHPPKEQPKK
jgi:hypothetical protein